MPICAGKFLFWSQLGRAGLKPQRLNSRSIRLTFYKKIMLTIPAEVIQATRMTDEELPLLGEVFRLAQILSGLCPHF